MNRRTKIAVAVAATVGVVGLGAGGAVAATSDDGDDRDDQQLTGQDLERASAAALEHTGGGEVTDAERDNDDESPYEVEVRLDDGREVDVHLDERFRVVDVPDDDGDDDRDDRDDPDDRQLTGQDLERASAAALEHTGGGEVTDAERDNDDESPYEVEVRLDDGREVDVHLDERFRVVDVPDDDGDDDRDDDRDEADDRDDRDEDDRDGD